MNNDVTLSTANALGDDAFMEPLDEGGTWLLDLVAAVDHLGRGARPHITVWDAIGEAAAWAHTDSAGDIEDISFDTLCAFLRDCSGRGSTALQAAIRSWVVAMAVRYNDGHHWPHPAPRRSFPAPLVDSGSR